MGRLFFPQYRKGREGLATFPSTILDHARKLGIEIDSECGGLGTCGRCVVRVAAGLEALSAKTETETGHTLAHDERLACQARIIDRDANLEVFVKNLGQYNILTEGVGTEVTLAPTVTRVGNRIVDASGEDLGTYQGKIYGLAIDVGTTTVVMQVLDLESGEAVTTWAGRNPQSGFGNDVISRIGHTMTHPSGLGELQESIVQGINEGIGELEQQQGLLGDYVFDTVVVGNSTMRSLFFGQEVKSLGVIPFEPAGTAPVSTKASRLGLALNPRGNIYGASLIGGHAGADVLADILASGMWESDSTVMLIDIGTNGEVALGNKEHMLTCSVAAGSAFEGANITSGVGAIHGAIRNVRLNDGRVDFETIGDKSPIGICGSGLIDLLAEMLANSIMNKQARIEEEFFVTDGISITQKDIYQLITAKAALRLDQDLLMKYLGVSLDEIDKVYLAGAFANFVNPESAIAIGLLVPIPERIVPLGNAALAGARQMLLSREVRQQAEAIASRIEHVKQNELEADFAYLMAERMYF